MITLKDNLAELSEQIKTTRKMNSLVEFNIYWKKAINGS